MNSRPVYIALVIITSSLLQAGPARSSDAMEVKRRIDANLNAWDLVAASQELEPLAKNLGIDLDVLWLRARLAHLRGQYTNAVEYLEQAISITPDDQGLNAILGRYRRTRDLIAGFKRVASSRGHFVILFQPGVDEVLVHYAAEALESAFDVYADLFAFRPAEPVRVEIYPRVSHLADVSPLKASEIRNSGTIALCKYNRLMIVSPRALVYGYSWLDTLAHEYIHLVITKRSRNLTPIWLQEGLAKFFENRWRERKNARLTPSSEDLLATALRKKALIRFEAMSPSMAKLPTQSDTALAFAEVFMVIEMLFTKTGAAGINQMIDAMRDGKSDQEAVEVLAEKSFRRFQREWKNYLYGKNLRTMPVHSNTRLLFRDSRASKDELDEIPQERARRFTYLGDRLAVRGRYFAAEKEYAKALKSAGGPNPLISAKLAGSMLQQGKYKPVERLVTPALELNPSHVLLYLYRGKARMALEDYAGAVEDLQAVIRLNPFDPEVHALLARGLTQLGRESDAEFERKQHRILTGS